MRYTGNFFLLSPHIAPLFISSVRCSVPAFTGFQQFNTFIFTHIPVRRDHR